MLRSYTLRALFSHAIEENTEHFLSKYGSTLRGLYKQSYPPIPGFATPEGTKAYHINQDVPSAHFRTTYHSGLNVSSVGIGSYQGVPDANDDIKLFGAIVESIQSGGVNVLDTAINYRYMKSERVIGAVLEHLKTPRDQLFISSKAGYIPADGDKGITEKEIIEAQKLPADEIVGACHCMHPQYLEYSLNRSLQHLGLQTLDLFYLHNAAESQLPVLGYEKFYDRLARAFEWLESKVAEGKIRSYGMATWVCFRARPDEDRLHLPLERVVEIAKQVGGEQHHFHYVQMPINLMMPEAFSEEWQPLNGENSHLLSVAREHKINLQVSSPLMGGPLIQVPLPSSIFQCQYIGAKHLQFLRSIPSEAIKSILIGQKANRHVKTNLEVIRHQPLEVEQFWSFFQPKRRTEASEEELDIS